MIKSRIPAALDGLVDLACRDGVDVRATLLRVLTDLYLQKPTHSAEEEIQYVELALGLIDSVDDATRAAVTARLTIYPAAPAAVLARLNAVPAATAPEAIPGSANLQAEFFAAAPEERRLILLNLDAAAATTAKSPAPVYSEVIKRLESAALQRNVGEFSRMLSRALDLSAELAYRITRDRTGEPIVVAAKALGMKAAVLQRILLFINPEVGQSVQRVFDLASLFDELSRAGADSMLAIWRQAGKAESAPSVPYQPVYYHERDDNARTTASPMERRNEQNQVAASPRIKSTP
jgi:hypothetical protein